MMQGDLPALTVYIIVILKRIADFASTIRRFWTIAASFSARPAILTPFIEDNMLDVMPDCVNI
jgi:hypothetical protein